MKIEYYFNTFTMHIFWSNSKINYRVYACNKDKK